MKRVVSGIFMLLTISSSCKKSGGENEETSPVKVLSFTPAKAVPGTEVVITGENFDIEPEENVVKFNGIPAAVTDGTSTELTVKVPSRALTGKISVTNSLGTGKSANNFEVLPFTNGWISVKSFPVAIRNLVSFVIGNKAYVTVGLTETDALQNMWMYDPETDLWTEKAKFPGAARRNATAFSLNGKGYVGLGYLGPAGYANDLWEYDAATDQWTKKADFKGAARAYAVAFAIGGKAYVGMGNNNDAAYKKDFWEYDPVANNWTSKGNFIGTALTLASGFTIGNKGYFTGGYTGTAYSNATWEYDPSSNDWEIKANFPGNARGNGVAFTIGSKGYFGTGFGKVGASNDYLLDLWEYDPGNNTWKQKANLGGNKRSEAVAFAIGNKGYIGTGTNGSFLSDFWEYSQ